MISCPRRDLTMLQMLYSLIERVTSSTTWALQGTRPYAPLPSCRKGIRALFTHVDLPSIIRQARSALVASLPVIVLNCVHRAVAVKGFQDSICIPYKKLLKKGTVVKVFSYPLLWITQLCQQREQRLFDRAGTLFSYLLHHGRLMSPRLPQHMSTSTALISILLLITL